MRTIALRLLWLIPFFFLLGGCDEGGGGGGDSDTASVSTEVAPDVLAEGGLAFVSVTFDGADFDDLDTRGLTIKVLVPAELVFVPTTSSLTLETGALPFGPSAVAEAPRDDTNDILEENGIISEDSSPAQGKFFYYVFPISAQTLDGSDRGVLQMSFNVSGTPLNNVMFTDIDRDALGAFDPNNADFDAENVTEFQVGLEEDEDDED